MVAQKNAFGIRQGSPHWARMMHHDSGASALVVERHMLPCSKKKCLM